MASLSNWETLPLPLLLILFAASLAALILSGEGLLRGATGIAFHFGISPLIVGLTIVSIATSLPELVASCLAILAEAPGLAVGNIVGSNAVNLALLLGITGLMGGFPIEQRLLKWDLPFLLLITLLFSLLAWNGFGLGRWDGLLLLLYFAAYLTVVLKTGEPTAIEEDLLEVTTRRKRRWVRSCLWVIGGAISLAVSADLFVRSSVAISTNLGVGEVVIGLFLMAIGTSIPELITSIIGLRKRQTSLVLGNLVGSNFLNLSLIAGTTAFFLPFPVETVLFHFEIPAMILITCLAGWYMFTERWLSRREGALLVLVYLIFATASLLRLL